jgi:hypothetical protein
MNHFPAPILEVIDGSAGGEFRIDPGGCLIGRGRGVAISLDDPDVSRRHARLVPAGDGGVVIADLGSTNGTWVNGRPLHGSRPLHPGDHVRVGGVTLQFSHARHHAHTQIWGPEPAPGPVDQRVEVERARDVRVAGRDVIHHGMHIGRLKIGVAGLAVVAVLLVGGFVAFPPADLDEAAGHWENPGVTLGPIKQGRMQLDITAAGAFRLRGSASFQSPFDRSGNASSSSPEFVADCSGSVEVQWHRLAFRVASGSCAGNFYGRLVQDGQSLDVYSDEAEPTTLRRTT